MVRTTITRALGAFCAASVLGGFAVVPAFASADPLAKLSANQVAARAFKDVASSTSVHFTAASISLWVTRNGCTGSLGFGKFGTVKIVQIGKKGWIQPSDQFWKFLGVSASQLPTVHGKWLVENGPVPGSGHTDECSIGSFTGGAPGTGWVKGKITWAHGVRELQLVNKKQKASMEVSDVARPLVLSISSDGVTVNLSGYNTRVTLTPPPPGDVIANPPIGPGQ